MVRDARKVKAKDCLRVQMVVVILAFLNVCFEICDRTRNHKAASENASKDYTLALAVPGCRRVSMGWVDCSYEEHTT